MNRKVIKTSSKMRMDRDSMGEIEVPAEALYGATTMRAIKDFDISGRRMPQGLIKGLGLVKWACATANEELGSLSKEKADLIRQAAWEIYEGKLMEHFPVDIFQTGSGTSSNTNVNEVIANRATQLKGGKIGDKPTVHPNDEVNMRQSTNDVVPTALHVDLALSIRDELIPALEHLADALGEKVKEFEDIVKIGRTHLMDATPLTLGQEFSGYEAQVRKGIHRAERCIKILRELAIGGTAVGTGINSHPVFPTKVCSILTEVTGLPFREAANHFEAQAGRDDCVEVAGLLNTIATSLTKVANDIRLLSSGPRCGINEISLPATMPGSSIMPDKVNPVMCEMLVQVCYFIQGLCNMVAMCGRDGHFELNVNIPLIAFSLDQSVTSLTNASRVFADRCVSGITANRERCKELVDGSLMLVTALNPYIGYDKAAEVAKKAFNENKTLREVVLEEGLMDADTLDKALDPMDMIRPKESSSDVDKDSKVKIGVVRNSSQKEKDNPGKQDDDPAPDAGESSSSKKKASSKSGK